MKLPNEVKVGMIVFVAAIIFFAGLMYLRGVDFQKKEYSLTILYNNVNGLKEGSPITVAGYAVGKVEDMKLHGAGIAVDVSVQSKVKLTRDSQAEIKSASIMGGKFISITPGKDGRMLQDGDTLQGSYQADLTELTSTLAPISSNVLGILENVNATFDAKTRQNLQNIVKEVNQATSELDGMVHSQTGRVDHVVGNFLTVSNNLARFTNGLDTLASTQRARLDTSLAILRVMAQNLDAASQQLRSTTRSLDAVMSGIQSGQGTLGKLTVDERLYNNMDSLAVNLNALVRDLKQNPGRYVKLSLF